MSIYRIISAERASFPVSLMCEVLGVSRSGFHDWATRAPSDRALSDAWLSEQIEQIHEQARGVYGAPRIHAELRMARGISVGRKRVERLMRDAGLSGLVPKKRGRITIRVPGVRVADDLVERDFAPAGPDVLWVADITYLRTWEGWLYLAAVQDAFSRAIVGWAMADHMRAELVVDALQMALARRRPNPGLIHHPTRAANTYRWASARKRATPASPCRWARAVTPPTTRWPRASSPPSRKSSSTATPGRHAASSVPPSSNTPAVQIHSSLLVARRAEECDVVLLVLRIFRFVFGYPGFVSESLTVVLGGALSIAGGIRAVIVGGSNPAYFIQSIISPCSTRCS